jgi:hypothetical protein
MGGLIWPVAPNPSSVFLPPATSEYVRPADWPAMPAVAANEIDILAAVWDNGSNYVAVNATVSSGTYTVDWGDGSAPQEYTSAATASYQYTYSDGDLGALTAEGYKTAIVKITPKTGGQNLTALTLNVRHSSVAHIVSNPWLDIQLTAASLTSLVVSGSATAKSSYLQRFIATSIGTVTTLAYCFDRCYSLQSVSFPSGSLASVTTLSSCFYNCTSLQSVSFPSGSLASVTTLSYCFYNCTSLQSVSFPSGSLASVTYLDYCFYFCYSLQSVSFPSGSLASVTTLERCLYNCYSLQSVSFPSGSLASVTTLDSCFVSCTSLQSVSFPSGSLASVTTLSSCFYNCYSLQSVSFPSGSLASVTTLASCFYNCTSLQSVSFPSGSLASVTTLASCFRYCYSLQSVSFPSTPSPSAVTFTNGSANISMTAHSFRAGMAVVLSTDGALPTNFTAGTTYYISSTGLTADVFRVSATNGGATITAGSDGSGTHGCNIRPLGAVTSGNLGNLFADCNSLASIANCGIWYSFTVESCNLSGSALDAIYTALPTTASQTITVTSNVGTATDTPSIATDKGWTVTGS